MRLFAERGFAATTVGDIEAAAGLQPRRGALYKHFASKEAVLEAGLAEHLASVGTGAAQLGALDVASTVTLDADTIRPVVTALGWWFLGELDRQRHLTEVLEHDGPRLPRVVRRVRTDIIDAGNRAAAAALASAMPDVDDPEAVAVLLLGALVALRRTAWTFGAAPLRIDDERAVEAWTELVLAVGRVVP
jgi:AcrR family transcriptional regulator